MTMSQAARRHVSAVATKRWLSDARFKPTIPPTDRDIGFAAGFYEGEGSCCRGGDHRRLLPMVVIGQNEREPLDWLRARFGGWVGWRNDPRQKTGGHWQWGVSGVRAHGFLLTVFGLLSQRRQAQIRKVLGECTAARIERGLNDPHTLY